MNKEKLFKPQGIFFDWDGTLVDSFAFLTKAHNAVKAGFGLAPFAGDEFSSYFGVPRDQLFVDIYGPHAEAAKRAFGAYYHDNHLKEMVVMEGALEMLDTIASLDIPMGWSVTKEGISCVPRWIILGGVNILAMLLWEQVMLRLINQIRHH